MNYLSEASLKNLKGTALLRLDFNTEDSWRMEKAIPTLKFLRRHADRLVVISHKGRPNGPERKFSLKKDSKKLSDFLGVQVNFLKETRFSKVKKQIERSARGSVFLLENLRFNKGEEQNDLKFAKNLAGLADYYVNEAFPVSHRKSASVVAVTKFIPSYAGFLLEKEIEILSAKNFARPLVLVLGGSKASDKLGILDFFKNKADKFLLGGGSANTFLLLRGEDIGESLAEKDKKILTKLGKFRDSKKVISPIDWKTEGGRILDIGEKTISLYEREIKKAKTVIWSGPMGFIEKQKFAMGNLKIAEAIAKNRKALTITGGGESVMFLKQRKLDKKFDFISTGGGAMIEYLSGIRLPGIEALEKSKKINK